MKQHYCCRISNCLTLRLSAHLLVCTSASVFRFIFIFLDTAVSRYAQPVLYLTVLPGVGTPSIATLWVYRTIAQGTSVAVLAEIPLRSPHFFILLSKK